MACHIHAASDGPSARRISPGTIDLTAIDNGIWMCFRHGKLIDTDETTYTVGQLRSWKQVAEFRADYRQRSSREPTPKEFLRAAVALPMAEVRLAGDGNHEAALKDLLDDSGAMLIWGRSTALTIRDFAVEITRNAFEHGKATNALVKLKTTGLEITDDGCSFDIFSLAAHPTRRGGAEALGHVLDGAATGLILTSRREGQQNINVLTLASRFDRAFANSPCVSHIDPADVRVHAAKGEPFEAIPGCAKTYLIVESRSYSDLRFYADATRQPHDDGAIAFILFDCSPGVAKALRRLVPDHEVIEVPSED